MNTAPRKVANYRLGEMLGAGAAGTVYRAVSEDDGQVVALKILSGDVEQEIVDIERRFVREISILNKLRHPNVIGYLNCGLDDGRLYYVMELVERGTMKDVMLGPLPWRDAVESSLQICEALEYIHGQGIVHRDLKPANLYLSADGVVKLGDFGLARDFGMTRLTQDGQTVGTYYYMAPEQIEATRVTASSDLYSLGCILYQMLVGDVPFDGKFPVEVLNKHMAQTPPSVSDCSVSCPAGLSRLVRRLMAKTPEERPADAGEVQAELRAILSGGDRQSAAESSTDGPSPEEPVAEDRPNLSERLHGLKHSPADRLSWAKLAVVALVMLGLIVLAGFLGGG